MKILICDNGLPFDLQTPYFHPLGGSETTALLLAKGLSQLNHQIVLLTNINYTDQQENIILDNINNFDNYAQIADTIILNRFIPNSIMNYFNKKLYYLAHDAYDQDTVKWMMNRNAEQYLTKILCVSNWQKNTFINYLMVDPNKLEVLGNPIDYSLYYGYTERDPYKLIFASIPFKGLEILPELFSKIKWRCKKQRLHLDIYSSFALYQRPQEDKEYMDIYRQLDNMKDVNLYNPVSMKDLAYIFKNASLYIHPSTYHETHGRIFTECMAGGCIPVTMNNGANKEVIGDNGYIIDYANIWNETAMDEYVDVVCDLLNRDLYKDRVRCEREMKRWDYVNISKRLEDIILRG